MWRLLEVSQQGPPDARGFGQYLLPAAVVIAVLLVIIIIILLFPRLRSVRSSKPIQPEVKKLEKKDAERPLDITLRLLNEDEKRVVELVAKSGGQMMQKDISYELKLNRVKTHRVLVGLIERGVVTAEKHFNTNMITLANWLMHGEEPNRSS